MKIFKFKHYKKNLDWGDESYNVSDLETFDQEMQKYKIIDKFYLLFGFLKKIPFIGKILKYFFVNFLRERIYILAIKKEREKIEKYFF